MEQRQLRLGDILDDYCPRERRLTNHAVVAMVGADVKQTRCTTCEAEHEYKHAKVPRQRRKPDSPAALYARVASDAPKHASGSPRAAAPLGGETDDHDPERGDMVGQAVAEVRAEDHIEDVAGAGSRDAAAELAASASSEDDSVGESDVEGERDDEEGPVHRQLIRASLPREGQPPPSRPIPEFTIRQPGGRPGRFRPRPHAGGQQFQGNRSNGNGPGGPGGPRGSGQRPGGRPPQGAMPSRLARRHGPGRKRSK